MKRKCVLIGSFRKHYDGILEIFDRFQQCGVEITSPSRSWIVNKDSSFVLLHSDLENKTSDIQYIESKVLNRINSADFVYVCDFDGYVGQSTAFEMGYAHANNKPIYAYDFINDVLLTEFTNDVISPEDLAEKYRGENND